MPDQALRVFLDTNVASYLIAWDKADPTPMRARLLRATRSGLIRVEGSLEVVAELTGAKLFDQVCDLLVDLVGRWWMFPLFERIVREVRNAERVPKEELYISREPRRELKRLRGSHKQVREVAAEIREHAEKYKASSEEARAEVIAELTTSQGQVSAEVIRKLMNVWRTEERVAEWCRDMLDAGVSRKWFAASEGHWPDPKLSSPTLWAYMEYRLARIALELGEGRQIKPSDEYDARHYSAAAVYADVLVTEDAGFQKTCGMLGSSTPEIVGLLDLDARIDQLLAGKS